MKNLIKIKTRLLHATFIMALLMVVFSCTNNRPADSKELATESNKEMFETSQQVNDAQFLVDAAEFNLENITLGRLAQQKGSTVKVKELGKMMQDKHQKSLDDLTVLAKTKMVIIPTLITDKSNDTYISLNDKSGQDFDKSYSDLMVSRHKDAISVFEDATTDVSDADIRNWAVASLPGLRNHLDQSIALQKLCDEKYAVIGK